MKYSTHIITPTTDALARAVSIFTLGIALLMAIFAFTTEHASAYVIERVDVTQEDNSVTMSGKASATPYEGAAYEQYLTVVWDTRVPELFETYALDAAPQFDTTFEETQTGPSFSTTWTLEHTYTTAGERTLAVQVHQNGFVARVDDASERTVVVNVPALGVAHEDVIDSAPESSVVAAAETSATQGPMVLSETTIDPVARELYRAVGGCLNCTLGDEVDEQDMQEMTNDRDCLNCEVQPDTTAAVRHEAVPNGCINCFSSEVEERTIARGAVGEGCLNCTFTTDGQTTNGPVSGGGCLNCFENEEQTTGADDAVAMVDEDEVAREEDEDNTTDDDTDVVEVPVVVELPLQGLDETSGLGGLQERVVITTRPEVQAVDGVAGTATIAWTTAERAESKVVCGLSNGLPYLFERNAPHFGYQWSTLIVHANTTEHAVPLASLAPGTHYCRAASRLNADDAWTVSPEFAFAVPGEGVMGGTSGATDHNEQDEETESGATGANGVVDGDEGTMAGDAATNGSSQASATALVTMGGVLDSAVCGSAWWVWLVMLLALLFVSYWPKVARSDSENAAFVTKWFYILSAVGVAAYALALIFGTREWIIPLGITTITVIVGTIAHILTEDAGMRYMDRFGRTMLAMLITLLALLVVAIVLSWICAILPIALIIVVLAIRYALAARTRTSIGG